VTTADCTTARSHAGQRLEREEPAGCHSNGVGEGGHARTMGRWQPL